MGFFRANFSSLWDILKPIWETFKDLVAYVFTPLFDILTALFALINGDTEQLGESLKRFFTNILYYSVKFALDFVNILIELFNFLGQLVFNMLTGIINDIIESINMVLSAVETVGRWFGANWSIQIDRLEYSDKKAIQTLDVDSILSSMGFDLNGDANEAGDAQTAALVEAISEGDRNIVNAINNQSNDVYIDGKKVSEEIPKISEMNRKDREDTSYGSGGGGMRSR